MKYDARYHSAVVQNFKRAHADKFGQEPLDLTDEEIWDISSELIAGGLDDSDVVEELHRECEVKRTGAS